MARNAGRQNRRGGNEDRVLRTAVIAVIVLFVVGAIIVAVRSLHLRPDTSEGAQKLAAMDKIDVQKTEEKIDGLVREEQEALEERSKRPNSEKFKDTLIIGDFIAQGIYEQEVLDESFVLAEVESCVHDTEGTGVDDNLDEALEKNPRVVFLELGVNDAALEDGSADTYEQDYRAFLEKVRSKLPNAKLYVNSILPVLEQAVEEDPGLENIPEYNEKLKAICKDEGIAYIDCGDLVKDEYYKGDGKHMTKDYFTLWADRMVEAASL